MQWSKPELGLVEFDGSTANNIVLRSACGAGILHEPHDQRPDRRYKMIYGGEWCGDYESNPTVRFSSDGLRWSDTTRCREINAEADTHCNAIWVPEQRKYVNVTRLHDGEPFVVQTAHRLERYPAGQRIVGLTESTDFENWRKSVEVLSRNQLWWSKDGGRTWNERPIRMWDVEASRMVGQPAPERAAPREGQSWGDVPSFSFGTPLLQPLQDGTILLVYYATIDGIIHTRACRFTIG